jgi:prepilin-type N-terminal cleavage/methylation domain-containing protein
MPLKRIGCDGAERSVPRGFSLVELIVVVAISMTIVGFGVPIFSNFAQSLRTAGDSRSLAAMIAEAKLRAAASFTHARVYANLSGRTYRLEVWNKSGNGGAGCWQTDGDSNACTVATSPVIGLSRKVSFGYGSVGAAPTNTQPALGQAHLCYTGYAGQPTNTTSVANTACIEFNSRGVPSDPAPGGVAGASGGTPDATGALYVTDGGPVYGLTVLASGEIQSWYSNNTSTPNWQQR